VRVVARSEHWLAFVPSAARWPVELHVYPRRRVGDLPGLDEVEREDFCGFYLDLLRRLDTLYGIRLPYVAAWHQAPVHAAPGLSYLHLELLSVQRSPTKIKYLAGSEAAMGAFINDVAPEQLAERLRSAVSQAV
jgi:UDPglucose--hexose-1-phosphate uridylyltransferase